MNITYSYPWQVIVFECRLSKRSDAKESGVYYIEETKTIEALHVSKKKVQVITKIDDDQKNTLNVKEIIEITKEWVRKCNVSEIFNEKRIFQVFNLS